MKDKLIQNLIVAIVVIVLGYFTGQDIVVDGPKVKLLQQQRSLDDAIEKADGGQIKALNELIELVAKDKVKLSVVTNSYIDADSKLKLQSNK